MTVAVKVPPVGMFTPVAEVNVVLVLEIVTPCAWASSAEMAETSDAGSGCACVRILRVVPRGVIATHTVGGGLEVEALIAMVCAWFLRVFLPFFLLASTLDADLCKRFGLY